MEKGRVPRGRLSGTDAVTFWFDASVAVTVTVKVPSLRYVCWTVVAPFG